MPGLNKVMLIGNLGADPEIRNTNNGTVANMRLATSESWKDRDGRKQEKTEWHTVVSFSDGLNGVIEDYCRKGSRIYVEGKLQTRKWEDRDGNDRYSTEIVIDGFNGKLLLLDSAGDGGSRGRDRDDDRRGSRSRRSDDDDDRRSRRSSGNSERRSRRNDDDRDEDRDDDRGRRRGGYNRDDRDREPEPEPKQSSFQDELDDDVPF